MLTQLEETDVTLIVLALRVSAEKFLANAANMRVEKQESLARQFDEQAKQSQELGARIACGNGLNLETE